MNIINIYNDNYVHSKYVFENAPEYCKNIKNGRDLVKTKKISEFIYAKFTNNKWYKTNGKSYRSHHVFLKKTFVDSLMLKLNEMDNEEEIIIDKSKMDNEEEIIIDKSKMDNEEEIIIDKSKMDNEQEILINKSKMDNEQEILIDKSKMDNEQEILIDKSKINNQNSLMSKKKDMSTMTETETSKIIKKIVEENNLLSYENSKLKYELDIVITTNKIIIENKESELRISNASLLLYRNMYNNSNKTKVY